MARKKYSSSADVARLAGVSQAAVSRTFTVGASVSEKTRKKVVAAAEELGYRPSAIPRIMLTQKSSLVAIVSGGLYNPFYAAVIELIASKIQERGNIVLFFTVNHGEYIDDVIPKILRYRVDGIVSALSIISPESAESCSKMNVPVVLFNGKVRNEWVASVCSDNVAGGREIAALFIRRKARRFGYIAGKKGNMASDDRLTGYYSGLMEQEIRDVQTVYGNFRYEEGFEAACELLSRDPRPDAIFCANDLMAIAAIEACRSKFNLRVPEDVMIAGFDDIASASWPSIGLTTIRQDGPRMVEAALSILDRMISGEQLTGGALQLVPAPLIERRSTQRGGPG